MWRNFGPYTMKYKKKHTQTKEIMFAGMAMRFIYRARLETTVNATLSSLVSRGKAIGRGLKKANAARTW